MHLARGRATASAACPQIVVTECHPLWPEGRHASRRHRPRFAPALRGPACTLSISCMRGPGGRRPQTGSEAQELVVILAAPASQAAAAGAQAYGPLRPGPPTGSREAMWRPPGGSRASAGRPAVCVSAGGRGAIRPAGRAAPPAHWGRGGAARQRRRSGGAAVGRGWRGGRGGAGGEGAERQWRERARSAAGQCGAGWWDLLLWSRMDWTLLSRVWNRAGNKESFSDGGVPPRGPGISARHPARRHQEEPHVQGVDTLAPATLQLHGWGRPCSSSAWPEA